jgi:beta-barrel assembly-enhancing protease
MTPLRATALGKFFLILVCLMVLFALAGCAVNPVTGKNELMLVSEQEEIQMGKEVFPNALWGAEGGGGEYNDPKLKAYLGGVITNIHRVSHRPNLPVSFAVQNSSVPNAWAIPGYVVITRGLLAGLDNEAEFAFVMGHEMGHVSARHSARQMTYGMLTQLGLSIGSIALADTDYGDTLVGLGAVGSNLLLLKFSRDDELEADGLGVAYMSKLGYDPAGAVSAHRNLQRVSNDYMKSLGQEPHERSFFEDLLSTHPRTQVRIEEIQQLIATTPKGHVTGDGRNTASFQSMVASLKNRNLTYTEYYDKAVRALQKNKLEEANNLLNRAINADRYQPPFYALAGFVYVKRKNYAEAERYFNGALSLDPNFQPAHRGLGTVDYFRQNYADSERHLQKSISLFPDDSISRYFLGMGYYRTNAFKAAIPHLARVAEARPNHPNIHGVLGQCYEQVNDLQSAYNQYTIQLKVAPNNEVGKRSADRAGRLKPLLETTKKEKNATR